MKTIALFYLLLIAPFFSMNLQAQEKKVLMHYMLWYGDSIPEDNDSIRHWKDGHADTALIGNYDSKSWSLIAYHILLSYSCGIDGLVANVKDDYDEKSLDVLVSTINKLKEIDPDNFNYKFAISYDDQGMDNIETAKAKFTRLRDNILLNTENYLKYNDSIAIFIWNYKDPPYLSAADYLAALNEIFPEKKLKVLWNEIEAPEIADSYYPWVKVSLNDSSYWGNDYLEWFYRTIKDIQYLDFATGGVWPGFDDRDCIWGKKRWIDRKDASIYDSTWLFVNNYSGNLPLNWVYIETWNDWNEGTEIEPSKEYGYQYLDSTIQNINRFKSSSIALDDNRYLAARNIYDAGWLIENHQRDSLKCYPFLKNAIRKFLLNDFPGSIESSDSVINRECTDVHIDKFNISNSIKAYPNPADRFIRIEMGNTGINGTFSLKLISSEGKEILNTSINKNKPNFEYELIVKGIKPGIYCLMITNGKYKGQQKVIIQ